MVGVCFHQDLCFKVETKYLIVGKKLRSYLRLNRFNRPETNCPINFSKNSQTKEIFIPFVRLNSHRVRMRRYDCIYKGRGKKIFFLERNFINARLKSKRKLQFIRRISVVPFLSLSLSVVTLQFQLPPTNGNK